MRHTILPTAVAAPTGKTTTIACFLFFLKQRWGYKGRILATAQSNVAVDNMLETAMRECAVPDLNDGSAAASHEGGCAFGKLVLL